MNDDPAVSAGPFDPTGIEWHPAQKGLLNVRLLGMAIPAVLVLIAGLVSWLPLETPELGITAAAVVVFFVVQLILTPRRVRALGWAIRDRDLFVRHGVLIRRLAIVPYTRVQYVDLTAGPVERLFGLTTLKVNTAAQGTAVTIPGMSPGQAAELRELLTDKTKLDPQP
jgi:membrane protein YdbS with pleckstrin-like domain